jgi:hypothetical protein
MELTDIRVINVGVLVTADTRPKDLSRVLDQAFEDRDEVLQFVVEGYGWDSPGDKAISRYMNAHQCGEAEALAAIRARRGVPVESW